MTVLQRPSKGMNSKCGRNRTVRGEQDDATLEDHRASREAIGKIIKTTQTFPMVISYSRIRVLCLDILNMCSAFTVLQGV